MFVVEVKLIEPLNLIIRGSKDANLDKVNCFIPSLNSEAYSLNEAYTKISQVFEPKRASHTGNVFKKCYYLCKERGEWYPLDHLREIKQSEYEKYLLLDYKVFYRTKNDNILLYSLSEREKKLWNEITDNGITGREIKELFKEDEFFHIVETINSLIAKGLIDEHSRKVAELHRHDG